MRASKPQVLSEGQSHVGPALVAARLRRAGRSFAPVRTTLHADDRIRVLFCCDPPFYQHLAVALVSMLENNPQHRFEIYLASSQRDEAAESMLWQSLAYYHNYALIIRYFPVERCRHFFVDQHLSHETYLRIFVAEIIENTIDKILYLDADVVVVGDLWELWTTDIQGCVLAAAHDPWGEPRRDGLGTRDARPCVNAGVLLLNLARWRAERVAERLVRFIEAEGDRLTFHDQDAINAVLHDSIQVLDYRWNFQVRMFKLDPLSELPQRGSIVTASSQPAIIHYNGRQKPWQFLSTIAKKRLYYRYLKKTEWRHVKPEGLALQNIPAYCIRKLRSYLGIVRRLVLGWIAGVQPRWRVAPAETALTTQRGLAPLPADDGAARALGATEPVPTADRQ